MYDVEVEMCSLFWMWEPEGGYAGTTTRQQSWHQNQNFLIPGISGEGQLIMEQ